MNDPWDEIGDREESAYANGYDSGAKCGFVIALVVTAAVVAIVWFYL